MQRKQLLAKDRARVILREKFKKLWVEFIENKRG